MIKKFIKRLLKSLAFKILDQELRQNWIHRVNFEEYARWMSRDFPIMKDMYDTFKEKPYGSNLRVTSHREEMNRKYFPKP